MAQVSTTILEYTKTGSIAIVWNGVFASVQFNCNCLEALHLCHGMCCRRRSGYSVELEDDELALYKNDNGILATKEDGMECFYLTPEGTCGIHSTRPKMCRQWHCSPRGSIVDDEIVRRDAGWMLMPVRKEENDFVQLRSKG